MRQAAARQRARHELIRDFLADVAHLLAADGMRLRFGDFFRAIERFLADDRCRQQLLFHAKRQQPVPVLVVEVLLFLEGTGPAAAFHLEAAAALQRGFGELALEVFRFNGPARGQAVDDEVLDPHGGEKNDGLYGLQRARHSAAAVTFLPLARISDPCRKPSRRRASDRARTARPGSVRRRETIARP